MFHCQNRKTQKLECFKGSSIKNFNMRSIAKFPQITLAKKINLKRNCSVTRLKLK